MFLCFIEGHKFISFLITVTCLRSLNKGVTLPCLTLPLTLLSVLCKSSWMVFDYAKHHWIENPNSKISERMKLRGCLYDTRMTFIPEWVSYQSEWVHSHDKIKRLRSRSDTYAPLAPDNTICSFQSRTKFIFSLHDTRIKFRTRRRISFGMKTTMTCTGTKFRFGTMVTVYREKCGERMNLFQDKSHSDITWAAP